MFNMNSPYANFHIEYVYNQIKTTERKQQPQHDTKFKLWILYDDYFSVAVCAFASVCNATNSKYRYLDKCTGFRS